MCVFLFFFFFFFVFFFENCRKVSQNYPQYSFLTTPLATCWMCLKYGDRKTNSVEPDQTAPSGECFFHELFDQATLFAQVCLNL